MQSKWLLGIGIMVAIFLGIGALSVQSQTDSPTGIAEVQASIGTAFTYQGYLDDNGTDASGNYDFKFSLYDAASNGSKIGNTITFEGSNPNPSLALTDGIFTVQLDFGAAAFTGEARYLEIKVRPASTGSYETLSPRQALTAVPYAHGLVPGATISGNLAGGMLNISNETGHGIKIDDTGGSGLYVFNAATNGVRVDTANGYGFHVGTSALDGVHVAHAINNGIKIDDADLSGVHIINADENGVRVDTANGYGYHVGTSVLDGVHVAHAISNGIKIDDADQSGVHIINADENGVRVDTANGYGYHVGTSVLDGVHVAHAISNGIKIDDADQSGVHIINADDNGVRVDTANNYGIFVGTATNNGVHVANSSATGVYAHTTKANGEWGFYTNDKGFINGAAVNSISIIAQVTEQGTITIGDLAAVTGQVQPLADSTNPMPQVRLASAADPNVIGVVTGRMAFVQDDPNDTEHPPTWQQIDGDIQAGDYVLLTVYGIVEVKIDSTVADQLEVGQRLTASDQAGLARPLRTETLNDMVVTEGAMSIGILLEQSITDAETVSVFVTLR